MISKIKDFLATHSLMSLYMVVFFGLLFGVYMTSGTKYFGGMFLYGISLVIFYVLFSISPVRKNLFERFRIPSFFKINLSIYWLLIPGVVVFIIHIIMVDGIPAFKALDLKYIEDVANYRNDITFKQPSWILYLSSITLKSVIPFLVLYFLYKKQYLLYWFIVIIALIYSTALIQKSFIIGVFLPSMIYCIAERKFLYVIKYAALMTIGVIALTYVANPPAGNNPNRTDVVAVPVIEGGSTTGITAVEDSKFEKILIGLADRLFIVPGRVVSDWFETIPDKAPYLYGDGYRVLAKIRGREYHNYPRELYPIIQPEFAAMGLEGSVNAASFMYEYSNFGYPGLILSGFILALIFAWVEFFFKDDITVKFGLCLFPVLVLSSGAITTLLFSGGFGFTILFYFLYIRKN